MEKKTLVLYPGFGAGHLAPMLELSKRLLRHGRGAVDVALVLVEPPPSGDPGGFAAAVARARASAPSVAFHVLPSPPPASEPDDDDPLARMFRFLRATNAPLRDLLRSLLSRRSGAHALLLDPFCAHALDVAAELRLPAYIFAAWGAASLAVFLALPGVRASLGGSFAGLQDAAAAALSFAGAPPLRASDLPQAIRDGGATCELFLALADRVLEARGILVNSFEALEPRAVRALLGDGLPPPVYCVGPLVAPGGGDGGHACLRWMDAQPDRSVAFLCFGSMGALPRRQLAEIAEGLEESGQRFLWVVRSPPDDDGLGALLPDNGFLERTKDRGLVVRSWAPQVDVLRHRAAGAFVTHCGWNSTLEAVAAGLPMLCWPLYAEQGLNKVFIVEEMRLGVEVRRSRVGDDEDVVTAEEVEAKVRWVMEDSDGARALRERAAAARERAAEALAEGGLSHEALLDFLGTWRLTRPHNNMHLPSVDCIDGP